MFAKVESWLHGLRRRLSRNEWAIRHLGLKPSEGTSEAPGLLLIQIDGFARAQRVAGDDLVGIDQSLLDRVRLHGHQPAFVVSRREIAMRRQALDRVA